MERNRPRDKRLERGEQTRRRILRETIAMIAEDGIKEVSAAKLAKATSVSKSNIFHHFHSIDEIRMHALYIIFDDLLGQLDAEYRDLDDFLQSLGRSFFQLPEDHLKTVRAFFSYYHEGMFDSEYQKALASCADQMAVRLSKHLTQLTPHPVPQETVESIATILLSTMDGMGLHYLLTGEGARFKQAWQLQVQMIYQLLSEQ
ncbi:TetR/AcrR family transcriptional regulator [Desmospora profundinema]|uniref:AcrR family transcriptional regulator n=1 Tax=Desmospora profundinema TaxID=1571184 RepID=A0ABU1II13_9BACL|nr:TetR/AcrR family transcriptional regulator [Desmospora profundinema]MDR6224412.1 AcrR family transcriptional regulator [Desmospora profundinema]